MTLMTAVADYPARASGGVGVRPHLVLVREPASSYQADPGVAARTPGADARTPGAAAGTPGADAGTPGAAAGVDAGAGVDVDVDGLYGALQTIVTDIVALDVAGPDDEQLRVRRQVLQQAINQLSGSRARLSGELERRAMRAAGPGREQQGLNHARRETGRDTRQSPSEVKQDGETGRRLADSPDALGALAAGDIPAGHARILAKTLAELTPAHPKYRQVHDQLVAAAQVEDSKTFGRTCRRLLAETDQQAAQRTLDRDRLRRRLNVCVTEGGMTEVHGRGTGYGAELFHTALDAFSRPQANDTRTPEQRRWDALEAICRTALDAGAGSTNRAVRPHVLITVQQPTDGGEPSVAEGAWTGPLPWTEVRRHLVDAGVSGVLLDANDAPIAVSETVRTVPAGLWKALQVRDKTCIADGCDVPAGWCQVMHLDVPYRLGGKLSLGNAAAGCSAHHRMLDHKGWQITWIGKQPILHHPEQPPSSPRPPRPPGPEPPDNPDPPPDPRGRSAEPDDPGGPPKTSQSQPPDQPAQRPELPRIATAGEIRAVARAAPNRNRRENPSGGRAA